MNINRMTNEETRNELYRMAYWNWEDVDGGIVNLIRQCVKDSQKELVEALSRIKKFKGNMDCEKVYEIIDIALASVEGKNGKK